jgi:glycosyltransferase involved in cell wall biosynthesis
MTKRVLFILKYREIEYNEHGKNPVTEHRSWAYTKGLSSGLLNSARFVCDMLSNLPGFETKLVQVHDNNDIDREVTLYKPTHVIIEAYWVVPEKFRILHKLHPKVKWIIRNHSNVPFLANEGIAFAWTLDYLQIPNVYVSSNHTLCSRDFEALVSATGDYSLCDRLVYLPNYYPVDHIKPQHRVCSSNTLDISCFGAIRPLKNHMIQAIAAVEYARIKGKHLRFHINSNRIEGNGDPILKNLREMFKRLPNADLIEHTWLPHDEFLHLISSMDMGLQVSYNETFNIVAADFAACNVPIVTSPEVFWVHPIFYADPNNMMNIVNTMLRIDKFKKFKKQLMMLNRHRLRKYNRASEKAWSNGLTKL